MLMTFAVAKQSMPIALPLPLSQPHSHSLTHPLTLSLSLSVLHHHHQIISIRSLIMSSSSFFTKRPCSRYVVVVCTQHVIIMYDHHYVCVSQQQSRSLAGPHLTAPISQYHHPSPSLSLYCLQSFSAHRTWLSSSTLDSSSSVSQQQSQYITDMQPTAPISSPTCLNRSMRCLLCSGE